MNAHELPPFPCYLSSGYARLPDAKIGASWTAAIFGDAVEVVPVYAGRPSFPVRAAHGAAGALAWRGAHSQPAWTGGARSLIRLLAKFDQFALGTGGGGPKTPADTWVYCRSPAASCAIM